MKTTENINMSHLPYDPRMEEISIECVVDLYRDRIVVKDACSVSECQAYSRDKGVLWQRATGYFLPPLPAYSKMNELGGRNGQGWGFLRIKDI